MDASPPGHEALTKDELLDVLDSEVLGVDDAARLLGHGAKVVHECIKLANEISESFHGNRVSFVVNRNINFTNACRFNCKFCAFHVSKSDPGAYLLSPDDVRRKVQEALVLEPGCTEICIQGGLHPDVSLELIGSYLEAIKSVNREMHVHGFSPQEIWNLSKVERSSVREIIDRLKESGLDSVPGTAAEILVDEVRKKICPSKITTKQWVDVITAVHEAGIPSTATIMYGHIETPRDIAEHLGIIRDIQEKTGGFTEFVPLGFMRDGSVDPTFKESARQSSGLEDVLVHGVARIFFKDTIRNIQCSWVKLGPRFAQFLLHAGVNDFSGTLMEENITRSAGGTSGEYLPSSTMIGLIKAAGRTPVQRTTTYGYLRAY